MMQAAKSENVNVDLVHQHGIWTLGSYVTRLLRQKQNIPSVVAPHGALETWALRRSRMKKALALFGYERANILGAECIHAVSEAEIADVRNFGLVCPIALIPNGVSVQWLNSQGSAESFREKHHIPADRRILLFLSRITPKKGLRMLIQAMRSVREKFADWILVVVGMDEFGHKSEVEKYIEHLGMKESVIWTGPLFDQEKRDAFAAAELFILPSYSEGAPVVILESLAVGVPVITTKASPWKDLVDHSCGWWIDASPDGVSDALNDAIGLSEEQLADMGSRGRRLVESQYTWSKSARKSIELYEWILGRRSRPEFVRTN